MDHTNIFICMIRNENMNPLSADQQYAFKKFKSGENIFITGPGGTGKTRLIKYFVDYMESRSIKYQITDCP